MSSVQAVKDLELDLKHYLAAAHAANERATAALAELDFWVTLAERKQWKLREEKTVSDQT